MMNNETISILIVDDHPVVVAGIQSLLQDMEQVRVAGWCGDARSTREFLSKDSADIVLLDINLPDESGMDLCRELRHKYPDLRILALSNYNERSMINRMLENGASGYLLKNATIQELQDAIQDVMNDRIYLSHDVARKMLETTGKVTIPQLTRREKEILRLIAAGQKSGDIAETLCISLLTVETHRRNIIRKFDAPGMTAVIKIAIDNHLI